jgi:hypothetical protein
LGQQRTLRSSFVASWYSWVMVRGLPLLKERMAANMAKETATPTAV